MTNGWTGGQYSLYRLVFGAYLAIHFAHLLPWGAELFSTRGMLPDAGASPLYPLFPNLLFVWDSPPVVAALLTFGIALASCFAIGWGDRIAAVGMWYVWGCLFTRNPLIANPSIPFVGWLLLAHACLPSCPFGTLGARKRGDPGGGWSMPGGIFLAAWIVMSVGYSYSGYTKLVSPSWLDGSAIARVLENPLARPLVLREFLLALPDGAIRILTWGALALELLFAPLALLRRVRPWLWLALLGMHLSLMALIDFADLSVGMVMLHFFSFDPAWIPPRGGTAPARLFHADKCRWGRGVARFVRSEAGTGSRLHLEALGAESRAEPGRLGTCNVPRDGLVVALPDGAVLVRSAALIEVGERAGGLWRVLALASRPLPRAWLDRAYDALARIG